MWSIACRSASQPKLIELTAHELSAFDGRSEPTDGGRPIYVAVAGDVYDVTVSRRIYGPGGSYHTLYVLRPADPLLSADDPPLCRVSDSAGKDASRAFVTGCFQPHHLTHDLRGLSDDELKVLSQSQPLTDGARPTLTYFPCACLIQTSTLPCRRNARFSVQGLDHWHNFFATSKKYTLVGHVLLPPIDPSSPPPGPCLSEGEAEATFSGGESRGEKPVLDGSPHARPRGEL